MHVSDLTLTGIFRLTIVRGVAILATVEKNKTLQTVEKCLGSTTWVKGKLKKERSKGNLQWTSGGKDRKKWIQMNQIYRYFNSNDTST